MKHHNLFTMIATSTLLIAAPLSAQDDSLQPKNTDPQVIELDMSELSFGQTKINESEITAPGPLGDLAGSYINAGENTPLVLIISGSGPTDRDGNNPLGVSANSYKLLAESLAIEGISSVRTDKRGIGGSASAVTSPNDVTVKSYGDDINAWVTVIQEQNGQKCIWLAGHSEGALVALAAAQANDNICGVVTIAGPGRSLDVILRDQLNNNPANAPILEDALATIDTLKSGNIANVSKLHPALQGLFNPSVQPYFIDVFSYDPALLAGKLKQPLLIIQGDNDIQVQVKDAQIMAKANPAATLTIIPNMNHVLKTIEGDDRAKNIASYGQADLPITPQLVDAISKFVKDGPQETNSSL